VRSLLERLADLANQRPTTIATSKHLIEDEAKTVASRVGGSVAYVNVPRACFILANDPETVGCRVPAPFKWNLNTPWPSSIAWTLEPPSPGELAAILESCNLLSEKDKEQLGSQLFRLTGWVRWRDPPMTCSGPPPGWSGPPYTIILNRLKLLPRTARLPREGRFTRCHPSRTAIMLESQRGQAVAPAGRGRAGRSADPPRSSPPCRTTGPPCWL
jgi:hypothetical protein